MTPNTKQAGCSATHMRQRKQNLYSKDLYTTGVKLHIYHRCRGLGKKT